MRAGRLCISAGYYLLCGIECRLASQLILDSFMILIDNILLDLSKLSVI